jgi:hypothetical protein
MRLGPPWGPTRFLQRRPEGLVLMVPLLPLEGGATAGAGAGEGGAMAGVGAGAGEGAGGDEAGEFTLGGDCTTLAAAGGVDGGE